MSHSFNEFDWLTPNTYDHNFSDLPKAPGVYLFTSCDLDMINRTKRETVLYVGRSVNLRQRCSSHEVLRVLRDRFHYVRTFFRLHDSGILPQIEKALIAYFNPCYNTIHRIRGT